MCRFFFFFTLVLLAFSSSAQAEVHVVTTIKPINSLVAGVMGDTGTPELLITGAQSPHGFQLKPSQLNTLKNAAILFYIDDNFETFLRPTFSALPEHVTKVKLSETRGISLLHQRHGGLWEEDDHHEALDDDGHAEEHGKNMHLWLSPQNAIAMVRVIDDTLQKKYPENAFVYQNNAALLIRRLQQLDRELAQELRSAQHLPFIVFHDAYHYFEVHYGLDGAGSITLEPDMPPSAGRIREIRNHLESRGIRCAFREPQFSDSLIKTVLEGTSIPHGTLDPIGTELPDNSELYFTLLRNIAKNLKGCLTTENDKSL